MKSSGSDKATQDSTGNYIIGTEAQKVLVKPNIYRTMTNVGIIELTADIQQT